MCRYLVSATVLEELDFDSYLIQNCSAITACFFFVHKITDVIEGGEEVGLEINILVTGGMLGG